MCVHIWACTRVCVTFICNFICVCVYKLFRIQVGLCLYFVCKRVVYKNYSFWDIPHFFSAENISCRLIHYCVV